MTNEDLIQQLIYRRNRIDELIAAQRDTHHRELLKAERFYVEAQIEFRQKHGDPAPVLWPHAVQPTTPDTP